VRAPRLSITFKSLAFHHGDAGVGVHEVDADYLLMERPFSDPFAPSLEARQGIPSVMFELPPLGRRSENGSTSRRIKPLNPQTAYRAVGPIASSPGSRN